MNRGFFFLIIIICFNCFSVYANEITEGNIQLLVNERTGGFTLNYRASPQLRRYDSLFNTDQGASYATIYIDGKTYRLGDRNNRPNFEKQNNSLSFIYKLPSVTVTQIFTPVRTGSSPVYNGINISFTIQNTGSNECSAGLKLLIDTDLGEGTGNTPFNAAGKPVTAENRIENASEAKYWISRGSRAALMGSVINPVDSLLKAPDSVYFASWRRLNDSQWKYNYSEGRSLTGDSAVCYYYEPVTLEQGRAVTYAIFLTAEDAEWFNMTPNAVFSAAANEINISAAEQFESNPKIEDNEIQNLVSLRELLNRFLSGEIELNEQNLDEIENAVKKFR